MRCQAWQPWQSAGQPSFTHFIALMQQCPHFLAPQLAVPMVALMKQRCQPQLLVTPKSQAQHTHRPHTSM